MALACLGSAAVFPDEKLQRPVAGVRLMSTTDPLNRHCLHKQQSLRWALRWVTTNVNYWFCAFET